MTSVHRFSYKADTASYRAPEGVPLIWRSPLHSTASYHHAIPVAVLMIIGNKRAKLVLVAVLIAEFVICSSMGD